MIELWKKDELKYNFVDSPSPYLTSLKNSELGEFV